MNRHRHEITILTKKTRMYTINTKFGNEFFLQPPRRRRKRRRVRKQRVRGRAVKAPP